LICCFIFFSLHVAVVCCLLLEQLSGVVVVVCSLCFSSCTKCFSYFFFVCLCSRCFNFIIPVLELLSFFVVALLCVHSVLTAIIYCYSSSSGVLQYHVFGVSTSSSLCCSVQTREGEGRGAVVVTLQLIGQYSLRPKKKSVVLEF